MTTPLEPPDEHGTNGVLSDEQLPWWDCGQGAGRNKIPFSSPLSSPVESSRSDATRTFTDRVPDDAKWAVPVVSNRDSTTNRRQSIATEELLSRLEEKMVILQEALGDFVGQPGGSEPESLTDTCIHTQDSRRMTLGPWASRETRFSFMSEDEALQGVGLELEDMISNLCNSVAQKQVDDALVNEELRELQTTCSETELVSVRRLEEQQAALEESRIYSEELGVMKTELQCWEAERDLRGTLDTTNKQLAAQLESARNMYATAAHEAQAERDATSLAVKKVKEIERDLKQSRLTTNEWCYQATQLRFEMEEMTEKAALAAFDAAREVEEPMQLELWRLDRLAADLFQNAARERQECSKVAGDLRVELADYQRKDKEKKQELVTIKQEVTQLRAEGEKTEEILHDTRTFMEERRQNATLTKKEATSQESTIVLDEENWGLGQLAADLFANGARERQKTNKLTSNVRFQLSEYQHKDKKKEQKLNAIRDELQRNARNVMGRTRKNCSAIGPDKNEKQHDHTREKEMLARFVAEEITCSELKLELAEERRLRLSVQVELLECEQTIQSRCRNELIEQQEARDRVEESLYDEIRECTGEMRASETKNAQLQEAQANLELVFVRLEEAHGQVVVEKCLIERDIQTLLPWRRNSARRTSCAHQSRDTDDDGTTTVRSNEAKKHDRNPNVNFKRLANSRPNAAKRAWMG
eukprot:GEMP01016291.1.p1 GENE.GEMP01016291.1~~GEMP01016291.1.p1  ORF type:complete len:702 (+),score=177.59 GEMP01016291.1:180-2285(+)